MLNSNQWVFVDFRNGPGRNRQTDRTDLKSSVPSARKSCFSSDAALLMLAMLAIRFHSLPVLADHAQTQFDALHEFL